MISIEKAQKMLKIVQMFKAALSRDALAKIQEQLRKQS